MSLRSSLSHLVGGNEVAKGDELGRVFARGGRLCFNGGSPPLGRFHEFLGDPRAPVCVSD